MTVKLELTISEWDLILKGLLELPAKDSIKLILKVDSIGKTQIEEQNKSQPQARKDFNAGNKDTGV